MSWLKLDDQIFINRKVARCNTETKMLYIVSLSYCANQLTDGEIPEDVLPLLAGMAGIDKQNAKQSASKLLEVCLWVATPTGWQIPDYLEYNPSKEQVEHNREVRSQSGRAGGQAKAKQNAKQNAKQKSSKSLPPSPSPSPSPITESNSGMSEYVSSSSNGKGHDDDLIDPEVTAAIGKWKETFAKTPWEGNPPVEKFHRWLAFGGPDVLCHMIGQASGKDNPAGWLYTTYDNWRKDGEVAPHIAKQVAEKKAANVQLVPENVTLVFSDGTTQPQEVMSRGA